MAVAVGGGGTGTAGLGADGDIVFVDPAILGEIRHIVEPIST